MNKVKFCSIFILFVFLQNFMVYGQELPSGKNKEIYLAFDDAIGPVNTGIYSGAEYIEKHRMINEKHKFFQSREFLPGAVYYGGQPFYEIPLKYNIFEDLVIVSPNNGGGQTGYRLFENKLQGFELNGHRFINISAPGSAIKGIYEVLFQNENVQVLKKYKVKEKMIRKDSYVHFEFRSQKPEYFFLHEGEYREVNRRNLLDVYPNNRSMVIDKYRNFRRQSGEQRDQSAVVLFQTLSQRNN